MTRQTLAVLRLLMDDPLAPRYGLELVKATGLQSGTLYPVLARLEAAGILESEWSIPEGRRPRRIYRLSPGGAEIAQSALDEARREIESPRRLRPGMAT